MTWLYVGLVAVVCAAVPAMLWLKHAGDQDWAFHQWLHRPPSRIILGFDPASGGEDVAVAAWALAPDQLWVLPSPGSVEVRLFADTSKYLASMRAASDSIAAEIRKLNDQGLSARDLAALADITAIPPIDDDPEEHPL